MTIRESAKAMVTLRANASLIRYRKATNDGSTWLRSIIATVFELTYTPTHNQLADDLPPKMLINELSGIRTCASTRA